MVVDRQQKVKLIRFFMALSGHRARSECACQALVTGQKGAKSTPGQANGQTFRKGSMYSRRESNELALVSLPLAAVPWSARAAPKSSSKFNGVQIGVETYSYRSPRNTSQPWSPQWVDDLLHSVSSAIVEDGIDVCEFWNGLIEPPGGLERGPVSSEMLRGAGWLAQVAAVTARGKPAAVEVKRCLD
jgi:hypothetical protein